MAACSLIRLPPERSGKLEWDGSCDTATRRGRRVSRKYPGYTNRKIRGLLCSAFGFRDHDFFKLRLYALHEAKFKLAGS